MNINTMYIAYENIMDFKIVTETEETGDGPR